MVAQFLMAIQLINFSVIRADIGECARRSCIERLRKFLI